MLPHRFVFALSTRVVGDGCDCHAGAATVGAARPLIKQHDEHNAHKHKRNKQTRPKHIINDIKFERLF